MLLLNWAFQVALVVKNPQANAGMCKRHVFDPWVRKIPWRRAWQPTPVLSRGESHGQRSLAGYKTKNFVFLAFSWRKMKNGDKNSAEK